jgi:alpha-amylase/alpha-mannosidase (GH57 family)
LKDPWQARDEYIRIILDRSAENMEKFIKAQATHPLNHDEKVTALKLLEMQRHLMLMYTSCGWFFDELSGIETVQVLQYAGRALQLGEEIFGNGVEAPFMELLEQAKSNIREHRDGKLIFERFVKPAAVDLVKVGAHYAMSSLFEDYSQKGGHILLHCGSGSVCGPRQEKSRWPWAGSRSLPKLPVRKKGSASASFTGAITA